MIRIRRTQPEAILPEDVFGHGLASILRDEISPISELGAGTRFPCGGCGSQPLPTSG
jgi:hypothetical protein